MNTYHLQVLSIPLLFLLGLLTALAPRWISQASHSPDIALQLGTCFAAGVFLSAGFLHLLPDATGDLASLDKEFPFIYLASLAGFVIVYLLDFVSHGMAERAARQSASYDVTPASSHKPSIANDGTERQSLLHKRPISPEFVNGCKSHEDVDGDNASSGTHESAMALLSSTRSTSVVLRVLAALSVHSAISGLALGVSDSTALAVFVAIIAHKGLAGFSLGVEVHESALSKWSQVGILCVFALSTPLGVLAGLLSDLQQGEYLDLIKGVSAGTFIFIGGSHLTTEMKERAYVMPLIYQVMFFLLGLGLMGALAIWV
eukprot:TRINITY_DN12255_c0_g1_i1.p2 TRINITY_DN12255_c0_g1~~TRINITY_DN12255_c0_g1_i1.p2  ORF type:complete len:316 (+),score=48.11 TRINITY_DN12255_c0_g1_i1:2748-3695(+)